MTLENTIHIPPTEISDEENSLISSEIAKLTDESPRIDRDKVRKQDHGTKGTGTGEHDPQGAEPGVTTIPERSALLEDTHELDVEQALIDMDLDKNKPPRKKGRHINSGDFYSGRLQDAPRTFDPTEENKKAPRTEKKRVNRKRKPDDTPASWMIRN